MSVKYNGVSIKITGYGPNKIYWKWNTGDSNIDELLAEFVLNDEAKFNEVSDYLLKFSNSEDEALVDDLNKMFMEG